MRIDKQKAAALMMLAVFTLSACVTPMGMTSSSTPLEGKTIVKNLGKAEGRSSSWSLLGVWSMGRPDIDAAIGEAVKSKNGDALINVRWYEKTTYLVLASITTVIVTGDVVAFEAEASAGTKKAR
mgnify:CR=1 FL=1